MTAVAEDVLFFTHTDVRSRVFVEPDDISEMLVGGCLVVQAVLSRRLRLDHGRHFRAGTSRSAHPDELVERSARHAERLQPSPAAETDDEKWLEELGAPINAAADIVQRLRDRGALRDEHQKRFGRRPRWVMVADRVEREARLDRWMSVMLGGAKPDAPTAVTLLILHTCGAPFALGRSDQKRWNRRAEQLFTPMSWQGDAGTPAEPVPNIDDETRRMIGDLVISIATVYHLGVAFADSSYHI